MLRTLLIMLLCLLAGCRNNPSESSERSEPPAYEKPSELTDYLPQTPGASDRVVYIDLQPLTPSDRLAILSLQGLANRQFAEIFTYSSHSSTTILDFYKDRGSG